ncbi:amidohydrolase family protein [Sphingomicrobium aestuariivivum]|uniref:amidohydrolase family protein n=1 Tax=Sphingomicrobium aestuariivivum TaxID=1582356 RepID=UPI001FD6CAC9|nr:amidohydrolase family protein [Sphingomicrobium aestuariivivum]MCJ8190387.1 amidohydrolase family protein [Sphingomicrobium aestuariivivum]
MTRFALVTTALFASTAAIAAPTPVEELMVPPEDAEKWVFLSEAGQHGEQYRWELDNGCMAYRDSTNLRGWTGETDETVCYGDDGLPQTITIRGKSPFGVAEESYVVEDGMARWKTETETGEAPYDGDFYWAANGLTLAFNDAIRAIRAADGDLKLLPSGVARLEATGRTLDVTSSDGETQIIALHYLSGVGTQPYPIWLDADDEFFGFFSTLGLLPEGYEGIIPQLKEVQAEAGLEATAALSAKYMADEARAPVLFDNVKLFDAEGRTFREAQAVLVADGVIKAIAPAGSIAAEAGMRVVDGTGKTLLPGLWDAHAHFGQDDWKLLQNIASGITSYRSPGAAIEFVVDKRERSAAGTLLAPDIYASTIIDQKHPLAAQSSMTVESEAEAIAAVREIAEAGLYGVKFYTSMNPEWIAPASAVAHELGLHVSGHIPATMRPIEAVRAGYDEITHLNFALMQFLPQEVVDASNTNQRLEGPITYAKDVDLDSEEVNAFVAELAERGTVVDPTITIFEDMIVPPRDGSLPKSAAPWEGLWPATMERGMKTGGYKLLDGMTYDDYQASYDVMVGLIGKLHAGGVTLVAGTDGQGYELFREIEIYEEAGLSRADALATATILPAETAGVGDKSGSITVGKEGDLILVDGDVEAELGALRRVETVVLNGTVIDARQMRRDVGIGGDPK